MMGQSHICENCGYWKTGTSEDDCLCKMPLHELIEQVEARGHGEELILLEGGKSEDKGGHDEQL